MKGGPTDPPNIGEPSSHGDIVTASMKGGPTDPPNFNLG